MFGLWTGLHVRSYEVGLNLACCMRRSSEMSELPDLRKSSYVSDEGGYWNKST